ncbi:hypothetical protein OHAE_935 [Ochrobactrum soli]|uniref:Uncharacterized protein n=1 Tax=Ochrobactrum soli TaxID=2448455 RepID=A0A2P9HLW1_9HYPH|nr:hypothetical protein OHAE_935 [[Ochrobactrum] soli]
MNLLRDIVVVLMPEVVPAFAKNAVSCFGEGAECGVFRH